jgi:lipopolysaccharide biosynthesis glycosyltransferase
MKFYVGFDSAHPEASETCARSIARFTGWNSVEMLVTKQLRKAGKYWRVHDGTESTDFTYTRFLVPHLCDNRGQAVFCDGDFLWRKDPHLLFDYINKIDPVMVVKHDIKREMLKPTKMDGKPQKWYPKKNWSSLMVFNNGHYDCNKLSPDVVSTAPPAYLHGFDWTALHKTPSLPLDFNHLVGYYNNPDPVAVHFTDGGPWLPDYRDVEFAEEWRICTTTI